MTHSVARRACITTGPADAVAGIRSGHAAGDDDPVSIAIDSPMGNDHARPRQPPSPSRLAISSAALVRIHRGVISDQDASTTPPLFADTMSDTFSYQVRTFLRCGQVQSTLKRETSERLEAGIGFAQDDQSPIHTSGSGCGRDRAASLMQRKQGPGLASVTPSVQVRHLPFVRFIDRSK